MSRLFGELVFSEGTSLDLIVTGLNFSGTQRQLIVHLKRRSSSTQSLEKGNLALDQYFDLAHTFLN